MWQFRTNLVVQFFVITFVIIAIIAAASLTILNVRLGRSVELLNDHAATTRAGTEIKPTDPFSIPSLQSEIGEVRWITTGILSGGFVVLCVALFFTVRDSWNTINRQRRQLEQRILEITALNELFQKNLSQRDEAMEGYKKLEHAAEGSLVLLRGLASDLQGLKADQERRQTR